MAAYLLYPSEFDALAAVAVLEDRARAAFDSAGYSIAGDGSIVPQTADGSAELPDAVRITGWPPVREIVAGEHAGKFAVWDCRGKWPNAGPAVMAGFEDVAVDLSPDAFGAAEGDL